MNKYLSPDSKLTVVADEIVNTETVKKLRNSIAKSTAFTDWQYNYYTAPISSLASLNNCEFDTIGAPWYNEKNYTAPLQTVIKINLFGIMLTTWHTLKINMPSILRCAKKCGAGSFIRSEFSGLREETTTLLRRVSFEYNNYADCGRSKEQIGV